MNYVVNTPLFPALHLFHSNDPPSTTELDAIRSVHRSMEADFKEIDTRIDQLKETLLDLLHERQRLLDYESEHKGILIRTVPPEILSEIFIYSLQLTNDDTSLPGPNHKKIPLALARVSRRWREVAFSTPKLYGSFEYIDKLNR